MHPSTQRVVARHVEAGRYPDETDWNKFVAWVTNTFPKQKFKATDKKTGSAMWSYWLQAGTQSIAHMQVGGFEEETRNYTFTAYGEGRKSSTIRGERGDGPPTLRQMQQLMQVSLKVSPAWVAKFKATGMTQAQSDVLAAGVTAALQHVKDTITGVEIETNINGDLATGEFWAKASYERTEHGGTVWPLHITSDYGSGKFQLRSFDFKMDFKTYRGMAGALARFSPILKKGMRSLPELEREWLLGRLNSETVVRRAESAKVDYSGVDEWMDTNVTAVLMLRSKKTVPEKLIVKWTQDHWSAIVALIPKHKKPVMDLDRQRGRTDHFDEPSRGMQYPDVADIDIRHADISVGQTGNRAEIYVNYATR